VSDLPRTPSFDLGGKRALVAGASSGIGLGCAVALAEAGAHVVCAARRLDVLEAAVSQMQAQGWSAEALALDITDLPAMTAALDQQDTFDIVLNAAGLARHSPAVDTQPDDFDAVMGVNLRGAYFLSSQTAKAMIASGQPGSIIHISSQMGHVGGQDRALYCASKHAVEGMVKAMAIEWGKAGIRINTICPTFIRTALTAPTFEDPERLKWVMDKIKLPRVGEVEDIMGAALFLASDASAMVTGTSMLIDGGWTAD
jgi:2-deoxy-D-gluconate 3-dehydrogenase